MKEKGFGLLEVITTVFVLSIIFMAVVGLQRAISESAQFSFEEMQAVEEARSGIDLLTREIREAQPSGNGSYPIVKADDQEFIFFTDIDQDEEIERVRYFLADEKLQKGVIQPTETIPVQYPEEEEEVWTIVNYVQNQSEPIFYYYNGEWPLQTEENPLDTPTRLKETKYMRVYLVINMNPIHIPSNFALSSGVQLRNLKENL